MSLSSHEVVQQCAGLTYRKLDHWCRAGVFGEEQADLGSGGRRVFDDGDLAVARVLGRLSSVMDAWSGGRGGMVLLYTRVANQVRNGERRPKVDLAGGIYVALDLDELEGS
ncbi:tanscription factor [Caudovirales GX15bay]|nr:tanscription factor [Caudovirales GX15bay]